MPREMTAALCRPSSPVNARTLNAGDDLVRAGRLIFRQVVGQLLPLCLGADMDVGLFAVGMTGMHAAVQRGRREIHQLAFALFVGEQGTAAGFAEFVGEARRTAIGGEVGLARDLDLRLPDYAALGRQMAID